MARKTKPTKAIVGTIVTTIATIAVGIEGLIADPQVKLVCQIVTLVAGAVGSAVGIYQTTNLPVDEPEHLAVD